MTTSYTLHTQVTKTETVRNRRRVMQQISSLRVLPDKSFLQGKGVLNPGQFANMFGSAEVLMLNSDQPIDIQLLDPTTDAVVAELLQTKTFAFDVSDTGDSYKVVVTVSGIIDPANIEWFAFDNLTVGSITGTSTMLQQQVNDNIAAIAALQADLVLLQADVSTNTAAIAALQTTLTALQAQLVTLDTTVQANSAALVTINATLAQIDLDITALQNAIAALETSQAAQDLAITALQTAQATNTGDITALTAAVATAQADATAALAAVTTLQTAVTANGNAITTITNDLSNLTTAVTDNDNDILSLQQLMATTTQNVADNTADILSLLDGGWPFSLGKDLEAGEIAAFIAPYDMKILVQNNDYAYTRVSPAVAGVIEYSTIADGVIGTATFNDSGTGTVVTPTEVELAEGGILFLEAITIDGMKSPSFTIKTERLINGLTPAPLADYDGEALNYNGGTEEPENIEFTKIDLIATFPPTSPRDLANGEQYTYTMPTSLPLTLGGGPVNPTSPVNIRGFGDPLGSLGIGTLFESDGITQVLWNDPRIVSGNTFTLERVGGAFNLALRFV